VNHYAYARNNPVLRFDPSGYQGCSAAQATQSPTACAGPRDPDSPYQGPDGLRYNATEPQSTGITILDFIWIPPWDSLPNDDYVLQPCNCECRLENLMKTERELNNLAYEWDRHTVIGAVATSLTLKGFEEGLKRGRHWRLSKSM